MKLPLPLNDIDVGIVNQKCFFCGQTKTVRFNEHYTWCPNCFTVYTKMGLISKSCRHITEDSPVVQKLPEKEELRENKAFIRDMYNGKYMWCSICGKKCLADGW